MLHYRALKQALAHGLQLVEIHEIISFKQKPWMKDYIMKNTMLRSKAKNKFEKDFYKLMNNAVFGKTMENVRKHFDLKMLRGGHKDDENKLKKWLNDARLEHYPKNIHNMLSFKFNKKVVELNKPIAVGMSILDLAKVAMYEFHYDYMLEKYGGKCSLLFTDTDSLCYEILTDDFYKDIQPDANLFDFSDYPKDHVLYSEDNKKVIGKMKDELAGSVMTEFIGLRPKMYSYLKECVEVVNHNDDTYNVYSQKEDHRHKGCPHKVNIKHENFRHTLETGENYDATFYNIRSFDHSLHTIKVTKTALSAQDDKRFLLDKYTSLSYGHYKLKSS